VRIICGWGKETDLNHLSMIEIGKKKWNPQPIISLLSIDNIKIPIYGLANNPTKIPYIVIYFCPLD